MNRAARRKMARKFPGYKKALKSATEKAVDDLEMMFKKRWDKEDETLNDGKWDYKSNEEDDIYND